MRKKDDDILDFKKDEDLEDEEEEELEEVQEENDEPIEKFTDEDEDEEEDEEDEDDEDEEEDEEEILEEVEESQEDSIVPKLAVEEEVEKELKTEKRSNKLLLIICGVLLIIIIILIVFLLTRNKDDNNGNNNNNSNNTSSKIKRPSDSIEYITLNQNYFGFTCDTDKSGNKLESLKKDTIIKCKFNFDSGYNVSELYFDISNSSNVKYEKELNDSNYTIESDGNTYKFSTTTPSNTLTGNIYFYYKVLHENDKTGYIEINNVIFKDDKNKYYKVLNKISSFPPEKTNKIYIYEYTDFENEKYYSAYKVKKEKETIYDTYTCSNEDCEAITQASNIFLIKDDNLIIYEMENKSKTTISNFDIADVSKYTYEIMLDKNNKPYGLAFLGEFVDNSDCTTFENFCFNKALSGSEIGYYSLEEDNFEIDVDNDFIGSIIYDNDYEVGILLMKNGKFGYYDFEKDDLVLDMTNKYTNIDYDYNNKVILLENKDKNGEYYYTFMTTEGNTFKPTSSNLTSLNGTNLYYLSFRNRNGKNIYYLFNSKFEQLSDIKYVVQKDIISTENNLIIRPNELYEVYNKDGKKLYVTRFENKDILAVTSNYLIVNTSSSIDLYDLKDNPIVGITSIVSETKFIKAEENDDGTISVYIIEPTEAENTNGNKYIINPKSKDWTKEEIKIEN